MQSSSSSNNTRKKRRRISRRLAYIQNGYESPSSSSDESTENINPNLQDGPTKTSYLLKNLQASGTGSRVNNEKPTVLEKHPWSFEHISEDFKLVHDQDYQYFSEHDIEEEIFVASVDTDINDNNPQSYMNDNVIFPWGTFVKTVQDNLVCKECMPSEIKTPLKVTKQDVCVGTKINLSCQHTTREISPEVVNRYYGLSPDRKESTNRDNAM